MQINVNDLFHCKGRSLVKINIMCKLYTFYFFLPHPRVSIVQNPDIVQNLGLLVILRYIFFIYLCFILGLICLTSMLKMIFCNMAWAHLTITQHVLIKMIFGIFAVSCTVHVNFFTFLPQLKLNSTAKLVAGLSRRHY